jgi:adenosylhomocysteine nucleosidase
VIGLVIATREEAAPLVEALEARCRRQTDEREPFKRFSLDRADVVISISGMGKQTAFDTTRALLARYAPSAVINMGIAGALNTDIELGALFRITSAVDWPDGTDHPWPCTAGRFDDLAPARLVTSARPVFNPETRAALAQHGDLVDMEGASVARASAQGGVPLTAIKCVSDYAGDGDRETLRANLEAMSQKMARLIFSRLDSGERHGR